MGKNVDLTVQLFKKGTVVLIPSVKFPDGVTKPKYAILLENADALYKRGYIIACFTTSRKMNRLYSWHVKTTGKILGQSKNEQTTIDCINRIALRERQLKKCKFIGYLPTEIWEEVKEANKFADIYLSMTKIKIFEE